MAADRADEASALADLLAEALATPDPLGRTGRLVFGEGNPQARLALVGEAPGGDEERLGRPFVGAAGKLLDRALTAAGVNRTDVWITNVVKHRPTVEGVGGRGRNRPPTTAEVAVDRRWVDSELAIIRPAVVVCLGAVAANVLIHPKFRLGEERGLLQAGPAGSKALATYHPSYPLRLFGEDFERVFGMIVQDLARAHEIAGRPTP